MKRETLKALEKSIKKWEAIVAGNGVDRGGDDCELCKLFATVIPLPFPVKVCKGCPVRDETGMDDCKGTPYEKWYRHHRTAHPESFNSSFPRVLPFPRVLTVECPECERLAREELEFLRSLLADAKSKRSRNEKMLMRRWRRLKRFVEDRVEFYRSQSIQATSARSKEDYKWVELVVRSILDEMERLERR